MVGLASIGGDGMRMMRRNQRPLWYAVQSDADVSYVRDADGNIIHEEIDGEQVPLVDGNMIQGYDAPVQFFGTIQNAGGVAEAAAYGVAVGSYQAKLFDVTDALPLKEMSLIWLKEPETNFGVADPKTADYRVARCPIALNQTVYLLKRNE